MMVTQVGVAGVTQSTYSCQRCIHKQLVDRVTAPYAHVITIIL